MRKAAMVTGLVAAAAAFTWANAATVAYKSNLAGTAEVPPVQTTGKGAATVNVDTANGRARAAPVTLDRIAIGGIVERAVPALIAQPGQLRVNLLGMSFLNRLEGWEVRGDRLILRGYP